MDRLDSCETKYHRDFQVGLELVRGRIRDLLESGYKIDLLGRKKLPELEEWIECIRVGIESNNDERMDVKYCKAEIVRCYQEMLETIVEKSERREELKKATIEFDDTARHYGTKTICNNDTARCIKSLAKVIFSLEYLTHCKDYTHGNGEPEENVEYADLMRIMFSLEHLTHCKDYTHGNGESEENIEYADLVRRIENLGYNLGDAYIEYSTIKLFSIFKQFVGNEVDQRLGIGGNEKIRGLVEKTDELLYDAYYSSLSPSRYKESVNNLMDYYQQLKTELLHDPFAEERLNTDKDGLRTDVRKCILNLISTLYCLKCNSCSHEKSDISEELNLCEKLVNDLKAFGYTEDYEARFPLEYQSESKLEPKVLRGLIDDMDSTTTTFPLQYNAFKQLLNSELAEARRIAAAPVAPATTDPIPTAPAPVAPAATDPIPTIPAPVTNITNQIQGTEMQDLISAPVEPAPTAPVPVAPATTVPAPTTAAPIAPAPATAVINQAQINPVPVVGTSATATTISNPATGISNPTQGGVQQLNGQPASSEVDSIKEIDKEWKLG